MTEKKSFLRTRQALFLLAVFLVCLITKEMYGKSSALSALAGKISGPIGHDDTQPPQRPESLS